MFILCPNRERVLTSTTADFQAGSRVHSSFERSVRPAMWPVLPHEHAGQRRGKLQSAMPSHRSLLAGRRSAPRRRVLGRVEYRMSMVLALLIPRATCEPCPPEACGPNSICLQPDGCWLGLCIGGVGCSSNPPPPSPPYPPSPPPPPSPSPPPPIPPHGPPLPPAAPPPMQPGAPLSPPPSPISPRAPPSPPPCPPSPPPPPPSPPPALTGCVRWCQ